MLLFLALSLLVLAIDVSVERWSRVGSRARAIHVVVMVALAALVVAFLPPSTVLAKLAGRLAMPTGLLFLLGWIASLLLVTRAPRQAAIVFALWAFYSAAGSEYLGAQLLAALEAPYRRVSPLEEAPFDAVFVLGGGVSRAPGFHRAQEELVVQTGASGDRVVLAARMQRAGLARLLVASGRLVPGIGAHWESGPSTAALWRSLGVPDDAIVVLEGDHDTAMEIRHYAAFAAQHHLRRVGLITSGWHLRRAMALAGREGLDAVPLPADRRGDRTHYGLIGLLPSGPGFESVHRACWEWLGAAVGQ